jgi:60 kDa SS-A/Ro ribonucleoprotein
MSYAQHFKNTPQSEPIFGKPMVKNAAGGYVFEVDDWQRLRRFLILGCEGGSYYESERKLMLENAACVQRCLAADGPRTLQMIVEVSDQGLAPKNDAAIFALAMATHFGNEETRRAAYAALPQVCRIGTHLFQFVEAREAIGGGWGKGLRRAVERWYDRDDLVLQALKYQQRGGWSHRDVLRLAHPELPTRAKVLDAICRPDKWPEVQDRLAEGYVQLQKATTAKEAARIITEYGCPREFVPTQFLTEPAVWAALLPHMPMTALVRNLGNLSKSGLLVPLSEATKTVQAKLTDAVLVKRSRLHPFAVLLAAKTYAQGHGMKGGGTWTVVPQVVTALDETFELAFQNVEPTGKRFVLGVDVSASMGGSLGGSPLSAAEAAAAMALVTARTEPNYFIMGFSTEFKDLGITAKDTLPTVLRKTRDQNFGGTDTAVAIQWALRQKIEVDVFEILTDNETWAGDVHTCKAIENYRRQTGILAKLAVVGFTATQRSVADRADLNSMDFVGMDASLPVALRAFVEL